MHATNFVNGWVLTGKVGYDTHCVSTRSQSGSKQSKGTLLQQLTGCDNIFFLSEESLFCNDPIRSHNRNHTLVRHVIIAIVGSDGILAEWALLT